MLKQENYNIETFELLEQQKFVVRKEVGIFQVITYFGLDGNTVGFLKKSMILLFKVYGKLYSLFF